LCGNFISEQLGHSTNCGAVSRLVERRLFLRDFECRLFGSATAPPPLYPADYVLRPLLGASFYLRSDSAQHSQPRISRLLRAPALFLVEIRAALGTQSPAILAAERFQRYIQHQVFSNPRDEINFVGRIPYTYIILKSYLGVRSWWKPRRLNERRRHSELKRLHELFQTPATRQTEGPTQHAVQHHLLAGFQHPAFQPEVSRQIGVGAGHIDLGCVKLHIELKA
jgi:hypothetical protein